MIQVIPPPNKQTYEELQQKCAWLKGRLRESHRNYLDAQAWKIALSITSTVSTVLLILTWMGYISI